MKVGESKRHIVNHCPECGKLLDAVSEVSSEETHDPQPGDWSICLHCVTVLKFKEDGRLRKATKRELRNVPPEVDIVVRAAQVLRQ